MLWVNLIMDTLGSLALATEPPTDELLNRKPYARDEKFITPIMWRNIVLHGIYQIILLSYILFKGHEAFGLQYGLHKLQWDPDTGEHLTIFFTIFVFL